MVYIPLCGRGRASQNTVKPREDTGMCCYQNGNIPPQSSVNVTIQMNKVGLEIRRELKQPFPRLIDLLPRIVHPLQAVVAFKQLDVLQGLDGAALRRCEAFTHRRQPERNARGTKRLDQIEGKRPNAANRISRHENTKLIFLSGHRR